MAWYTIGIGAVAQAAFAANEPVFIPNGLLRATSINWQNASFTNINDLYFPTYHAVDGYGGSITKPDMTGSPTEVNLVFQIPTDVEFDSIIILNHNFNDIGALNSIKVQVDNASTFSGPHTIGSIPAPSSGNPRLVAFDSSFYVSGGDYLRLQLIATTAFSAAPQLGQLIVGRRIQLASKPDDPWAPERAVSEQEINIGDNGVLTYFSKGAGLRKGKPQWRPSGNDGVGAYVSLDNRAAFRELYKQTRGFSDPFCICYDPTSNKNETLWVKETSGELNLEYRGLMRYQQLEYEELIPGYNAEQYGWANW